jgi:hypothetical protein
MRRVYPFLLSFALGRRPSYPHLRQREALGAFLASHFMQIFLLRSLSSASLKRPISVLSLDEYERAINKLARGGFVEFIIADVKRVM